MDKKYATEEEFTKALQEVLDAHEEVFKKLRESEIMDEVKKTFPGN